MSDTSNTVQPPSVGEHDGWEVHSSSIDQPKPEQIVERLTDVPDDEQVEQKANDAAEQAKTADEEQKADTAVTEEQKKRKSASQRDAELRTRIAAETKAYHDARRAREFEQAEILRLRREREALQQQSKPEEKAEAPADKPVWAKFEADGKSYEEFLDARAEFDRKQTIELARKDFEKQQADLRQKALQQRQQSQEAQQAQAHQKRINEAAQKHEDFFEVIEKNLSDVDDSPFLVNVIQTHDQGAELLYHLAKNPDEARVISTLTPSRYVADAIRYSDMPIELLSHFAQHPQELDRLSRLHPATALMEMGEVKARLKSAKDGSLSTEQVSNAKPPIRPVGGGRTSASKDSDDLPFGPEWIRAENKRERERKKTSAYF
jgi:hypothetical protein